LDSGVPDWEGGSFFGAVVHAANAKTAAIAMRRTGIGFIGGHPADGVLFTNSRGRRFSRSRFDYEQGEHNLAKPNFGYQKRQKELEKKRKKEEKMKRKLERQAQPAGEAPPPAPEGSEPT
jgi:hypothetical protein